MQSALAAVPAVITPHRVREIVARTLKIDPARLDPARSLASYGLDSLTAVELVADLEDALRQRLPEWLLAEHPTLAALTNALCGTTMPERAEAALMRADCELPADIVLHPHAQPAESPRHVLLTGATGFLGAFLLRELLEEHDLRVTCLVRSRPHEAFARVKQNLERYRLWEERFAWRLDLASGDLAKDRLGLGAAAYEDLAHAVDGVYHAAADVNWVMPYDALRDTNVRGTLALLRFASIGQPKQFHFVSSLSVCYASDGPALVNEDTDMLPYLEQLPLGYAQSKCVAETLVRQAARRGLRTRIYRPALIAGDARTGASNIDDLIAALLKGCIQMGAAPDLDWAFDAVPVDHVARAVIKLARGSGAGLQTLHLKHPRPRHWRECILWANFFGYRIRLEPFDRWRDRVEREACCASHPLHRLRSFFLRRVVGDRTVAELYEERTRAAVADDRCRLLLQAAGIECPALDADLMEAYFDDYAARGFLPHAPVRLRRRRGKAPASIAAEIQPLLRSQYADEHLVVRHAHVLSEGSERSVIGELMSWRHGRRVGLSHYRLALEGQGCPTSLDVIVKTKAPDEDVLEVGETLADVCDSCIAKELRRFRDTIGIRQSHLRELALYEHTDHRLARHRPHCYGTWRRDADAAWGLVIEWLDDMMLIDACDEVWANSHIAAAIRGLATIHSVWLGRERELIAQPWIGHLTTAETMKRMTPLWQALAAYAAPRFDYWAGRSLAPVHHHLAETASDWWPAFEDLPRTLIHNDFNSRNIGLRRTAAGPLLVAYDWELATLGAPQRDLAELLCFVLPADVDAATLSGFVDLHRTCLEDESGTRAPSDLWRAGFVSGLADFLVTRLSFYALIDRVKPQRFLPRVVRTWQRLYELSRQWQRDVAKV